MKFKALIALLTVVTLLCAMIGCTGGETQTDTSSDTASSTGDQVIAVTDNDIKASESTDKFSITTDDGAVENDGDVYTVTKAGTYTVKGLLQGQIIVEAGEDDEVVLELDGATVKCSTDSPLKLLSAKSVEISAKGGSENVIVDQRSAKTADDEAAGEAAIYAKTDLKLKGTGILTVTGGYNNGIHTTKDLTVQKLSLKATAYNNAIKGNDSVTVKSGTVVAISTNGDGVKTENTDTDKSGGVRGDIQLVSGSITVYAAGDGFQSAHDFIMSEDENGNAPTLTVYTGSYSGYTATDASTTSYKGIKVQNELNIYAGSVTIQSYDDGLHADYGTSFTSGGTGKGNINISGGTITLNVYAPENKTAGGRRGPGGWGGQQAAAGADGIHADNTLTISGGVINVDSAYEGLEANIINVSGGKSYVSATDDGINACKGNSTPAVNVTGGYLDVAVSSSGDTDGIDSNGTYTQTGGVVITRGPNSQMAAAIDTDGTATVTGGTVIILGYGSVKTGTGVKTYSLSLNSAGEHTVKIDGETYTFTNSESYGRTTCYSSVDVTG